MSKDKGGRPTGPKTRCSGQWTEARYRSFIISMLRQGTQRWGPIQEAKKAARTRRGFYRCDECKQEVPATVKDKGRRKNNAIVDHRLPVVDPEVGFTTWDEYIERMFCEKDNLQVLCNDCHTLKSNEEREIAKQRRAKEKQESYE